MKEILFNLIARLISILLCGVKIVGIFFPFLLCSIYFFSFFFQNDILHNPELGMLINDYLGVNLEFLLPNIYSRTFRLFGLSCERIVFYLSVERIRANYDLSSYDLKYDTLLT